MEENINDYTVTALGKELELTETGSDELSKKSEDPLKKKPPRVPQRVETRHAQDKNHNSFTQHKCVKSKSISFCQTTVAMLLQKFFHEPSLKRRKAILHGLLIPMTPLRRHSTQAFIPKICQGQLCSFNCNRKQLCQKSTVSLGFLPAHCSLFWTTPARHARNTCSARGLYWLMNGHILHKRTCCFAEHLRMPIRPSISQFCGKCTSFRSTTKGFHFSCIYRICPQSEVLQNREKHGPVEGYRRQTLIIPNFFPHIHFLKPIQQNQLIYN